MSASENRGDIFALSVRPEVRGIAWSNYSSSDDDVGTRWRSASNLSVSPERSLQSTVVISCVRIISESIAGLPLSLYRKTPNGSRAIASELHLHKVLSFAPNNWQTKFEFIEQVCINLLLWGNSYSLIQSGQHGAVESLHNLHPSRMQVDRLENGRLRYTYTNPQNGGVEYYTQDAIMHIRWTPEPDGMKGMVPVQISRDAIALARSLEIHASKFWANAARPGTVLTHPGNLSSEAAEKLRDNWERAHMGSEKSYKTAVLTGGLQVTELGFTNEASQFVASRTFQTEEICRIYRLPLHLVQGTSSGSLEVQGQEFVTWTLAPWLERIQSAISRSLIYNDDLFVAGFDTRGLLRADSQSRASYYSTCTNLGILSINECRAMEGLSPLGPEADNHFIGMNQQTIQDAAKPKVAPDPSLPPPPATGGVPSLPGVATGAPPSPSEIGVPSAVKNPDKRAWCEGDVVDGGEQLNNCSSAGISTGGKFDVKKLLAKIASPDSAEGFTLDVLTADQPETGIMVSTFHNDSDRSTRIPKSEIHTDAAAKVLKDFIEVNSREIIDRPDRYIGGWLDGDEFYLDIATRFDPDKAEAALEAGRDAGQLAVFNLGTFKETYIHYSPQDTRLPMGWSDSFARAKKKAGADHAELDTHGHTSVRMMEALASRGYTDAESRAIVSAIHGTEEDHNHGREAKETGGHEGGRAGRRQQAGSVPRDESVGRAVGEEAGEDVGAGLVRGRAGRFTRFIQLAEEEARVYCPTGTGGGVQNDCGGGTATKEIADLPPMSSSEAATTLENYRPFAASSDRNSDYIHVPTDDTVRSYLKDSKDPEKLSQKDKFGASRELPKGSPVALRIDIPVFNNSEKDRASGVIDRAVYAVSVHNPGKAGQAFGKIVGYDSLARLDGEVVFSADVGKSTDIASGKTTKLPVAVVHGKFDPSREIPKDVDSWTAVGFDPFKATYFYDKKSGREVIGGTHAVSVGNTVFTTIPVYGTRNAKTDYRSFETELSVDARAFCPTGVGGGINNTCGMGIGVNDKDQDFTKQILAGLKTSETRETNSLKPYIGKTVGLVRTGKGPATLVGTMKIGEPKFIKTKKAFDALYASHQVAPDSDRYIGELGKFVYPLTEVQAVKPVVLKTTGRIARKLHANQRDIHEEYDLTGESPEDPSDGDNRAFCPTGPDGGLDNSCGGGGRGTAVAVNEDWKTDSDEIIFSPRTNREAPSDGFSHAGWVTISDGAKLNKSLENIGVDLAEAASVMVPQSDDVEVIMAGGVWDDPRIAAPRDQSDLLVSDNTVTAVSMKGYTTTTSLMRVPESGDPVGVFDGWNRTPGDLVLTYHHLEVPPEAQESSPTAVGREMMSGVMNSIRNAEKIGVDVIEMVATGSQDSERFKGYRIWPRLGFDGAIPTRIYDELSRPIDEPVSPLTDDMLTPEAIKSRDSGTLTVQQLYDTREGQRWWEKNGSSMPMTLSPGSTRSAGWKRFKALSGRFSSRSLDVVMAFGGWATPECRALLELSWAEFRGGSRDSGGTSKQARAWCPTGPDGGLDNSCSSADAATQSPEASAAIASHRVSDSVTHNAVASPPTQRSSDGKTLISSSAVPEIIRSGPEKNCYSFGGREYLSTVAAGQHLESQQAASRGGVVINTKKPLTGENLEYMVASHVAQAEQAKSRNITPLFYTAAERANQLNEYAKINPAIMGGRAKAGFEVTPEVGEFIFRVAQAQTSPNASPAINMDRADAIINKVLKGDGRFTTSTVFGVTGKSIKNGLSRFQAIVDTLGKRTDGSIDTAAGLEGARQLLVGQTAPAGQFEELFADQLGKQDIKWKPGNYLVNQEVPLFSTFGPKVGPFFENNYGNLDWLTADVWATRTFARDSGELVVPANKENARKYAGELEKVLRSATDEQFHGVNVQDLAADVKDMKTSGIVGDTLRAWSGARLRHYAGGDYKEKKGKGGALNSAAKRVVENDIHLMGAPSGGNVRANLITVYNEAAKRTGLEVANLQDVLWQDEQDAYAATGAKTSTTTGTPSFYSAVINVMAGNRANGKKPMLARRDTRGENVISAGYVDDYDKGGREELLWGIGLSEISDQEFANRVIGMRSSVRSRDASLGEPRAWCNTGEGGGLDNSCSSVPHTSFIPINEGGSEKWGTSSGSERHGTRYGDAPLFHGAEKIGDIQINNAKHVRAYIEGAMESTLPDVLSASGVAVGKRDGVDPPRVIVGMSPGDGLTVEWSSKGRAANGETVTAVSAFRVLTPAASRLRSMPVAVLHSYEVDPDFRGKGIPLESVARMVYDAGVSRIMMPTAARAPGWVPDGETREIGEMNGYRVWPKYGFDARLDQVSENFSRALANSPHADVGTVQKLLLRPGGKEFWQEHGDSVNMEFSLKPRSDSRATLEKLMEKWKYGRELPK